MSVTVLVYQCISVLLLVMFCVLCFLSTPRTVAAASAKANGDPNKPIGQVHAGVLVHLVGNHWSTCLGVTQDILVIHLSFV